MVTERGTLSVDATSALKLQQEFLTPFIEGTVSTLSTMASMNPTLKGIEMPGAEKFSGDVSAVMGLTGESVEGFVGISFTEELGSKIVSAVLGMDPSDLEPGDINDGVGELINMIAGSAKNALLSTPFSFRVALPNVISGKGHEVGYPKNATCWRAVLLLEGDTFDLHVAYVQK